MTLDEFRGEMDAYWRSVNEEAKTFKDPHIALDRLRRLYEKFDAGERRMADQILAEWILESVEGRRSYALTLIDDLKITDALPSLRKLAAQLASSSQPGASFKLQRVNRIIEEISR